MQWFSLVCSNKLALLARGVSSICVVRTCASRCSSTQPAEPLHKRRQRGCPPPFTGKPDEIQHALGLFEGINVQ